jgi:hypothetical protein
VPATLFLFLVFLVATISIFYFGHSLVHPRPRVLLVLARFISCSPLGFPRRWVCRSHLSDFLCQSWLPGSVPVSFPAGCFVCSHRSLPAHGTRRVACFFANFAASVSSSQLSTPAVLLCLLQIFFSIVSSVRQPSRFSQFFGPSISALISSSSFSYWHCTFLLALDLCILCMDRDFPLC